MLGTGLDPQRIDKAMKSPGSDRALNRAVISRGAQLAEEVFGIGFTGEPGDTADLRVLDETGHVKHVLVAGRLVVRDGQLVSGDVYQMKQAVDRVACSVLRGLSQLTDSGAYFPFHWLSRRHWVEAVGGVIRPKVLLPAGFRFITEQDRTRLFETTGLQQVFVPNNLCNLGTPSEEVVEGDHHFVARCAVNLTPDILRGLDEDFAHRRIPSDIFKHADRASTVATPKTTRQRFGGMRRR